MTGKIVQFDAREEWGVIAGEDGRFIRFDSASILAYDLLTLRVGQQVTYEQPAGTSGRARAVFIEPHTAHPVSGSVAYRYTGFQQAGPVRRYRFDRLAAGESCHTVTVDIDQTLFVKYRVGIQEGPAIAHQWLMGEGSAGRTFREEDMARYLSRMPVPSARKPSKRRARTAVETEGAETHSA